MNKIKAVALTLTLSVLLCVFSISSLKWTDTEVSVTEEETTTKISWELVLVNDDNYLPDDYDIYLLTLSNGEQVDERIYPALQQMFDDMRALGHKPMVVSGYRSPEDQQAILDAKCREYIKQGYASDVAKEKALEWVAEPGTSEHQLGIAVDINPDYTVSKGVGFYEWLKDNAYKYGFIKRYPEDKVEITGISNERWHYRYVGKEAAKIMFEQNLCLEEYLEYITEPLIYS